MSTNTAAKNLTMGATASRLGLSLGALQLRLHRGTFPITPIRLAERGHRYFNADAVEALASGGIAALEAFLADK